MQETDIPKMLRPIGAAPITFDVIENNQNLGQVHMGSLGDWTFKTARDIAKHYAWRQVYLPTREAAESALKGSL